MHTTSKPNHTLASAPNHASLSTLPPARRDVICSLAAAAFLVLSACDARRSGTSFSEPTGVLFSELTDLTDSVVPVTSWTVFAPSIDTQNVYVSSSSGNDGNSGLSATSAKQTIAAAVSVLRPNRPDWLHIKRGDTFQGGLGDWYLSGRSATEPMVITTYGTSTARPLFQCGTGDGFSVHGGAVHDVAFVGLHFDSNGYNGGNGAPYGVSLLQPCTRLLIEDCKIERFYVGLRFQGYGGTHHDLKLRRSVIVDSWTTGGGNAQGIYVDGTDGCLIEECVFDHNGWRDNIPGAVANIYRHNVYVQDTTSNIVLRGNIIARGGSHGMQARSGGVVNNNLLLNNSVHLVIGSNFSGTQSHTASVIGNVMLDGKNISSSEPRGWGPTIQCLSSGEIAYNVMAHNVSGSSPHAYEFDSTQGVGIHNVNFHHNVSYKWGGPCVMGGNNFSGLQLRYNELQEIPGGELLASSYGGVLSGVSSANNRFYTTASSNAWMFYSGQYMSLSSWKPLVNDTTSIASQVSYPRANQTIANYDSATGGSGNLASFMSRARNQSRLNWNTQLVGTNAAMYFRSNFNLP